MIGDSAELIEVLRDTPLAGRQILELEIPGCSSRALAVEIGSLDVLEAWRAGRERLDRTGRWPVVTVSWLATPGGDWASAVRAQEAFSRVEYRHELRPRALRKVAPASIVAAAGSVDLEANLRRLERRREESWPLRDRAVAELESMASRSWPAPERAEVEARIDSGEIASKRDLERWLLDWELSLGIDVPGDRYLEWFPPRDEPASLLLLPTSRSWESLAYLHFFGSQSASSEGMVALLQEWSERFGAELVAHYGTILQFVVGRPPATLDDAFHLAWQQELVAECTTVKPGVPLRHHARVLLGRDRWFLHDRP